MSAPGDSSESARPAAPPRPVATWLALGGVVFLAHFLLFRQFGLYEDDYIYTLPSFGMDLSRWWSEALNAILHPVQARPLNHLVRRTLFALTLHWDTLDLAYLASWALITTNAFLLFRFVRHRFTQAAAFVAALLYVLHPADNARQIIMHQTDIHLGTMLLLFSLNLFAAGRLGWGWFVGGLSLVNYESFYLPLLLAPLFCGWDLRTRWRGLLGHAALWVAIIAAVAATRFLLGEERTTGAAESPVVMLTKIAHAVWIGPITSLRLLTMRPVDALLHLTPLLSLAALGVAIASYRWLRPSTEPAERPAGLPLWCALGGILGLGMAYLFAFRPGTYPPIVSIGRLTAHHAPGILCTALAVAALHAWFTTRFPAARKALPFVLAPCFGLMAAFAVEIQTTEYAAHWEKQKAYWRTVLEQSGDLQEDECILVDVEGAPDVIPITPGFPRFGTVNYPPQGLRFLAQLPATWKKVPRVYGLWADTPAQVTPEGLLLGTPPYFGPADQPKLREGKFIFLRDIDGRLRRVSGQVEIRGHTVVAKVPPAGGATPGLAPSPLFRGLCGARDGHAWFTIANSRNYPE